MASKDDPIYTATSQSTLPPVYWRMKSIQRQLQDLIARTRHLINAADIVLAEMEQAYQDQQLPSKDGAAR